MTRRLKKSALCGLPALIVRLLFPHLALAVDKSQITPDSGRPKATIKEYIKLECKRPVSTSATNVTSAAEGMAKFNWVVAVSRRNGDGYTNWDNAQNKNIECVNAGTATGNTGHTFSGQTCTATATPCRVIRL